jgi:DNA primase
MFNVEQFLKDYHINYWTEGKNVSPGFINTQCIHCEDSSNHLGWNLSKEYLNCWKCGQHSLDYTISKLLQISKGRAQDIIFEYQDTTVLRSKLNKKEAQATSIKLPGVTLSKFHKQYLKNRNYNPDYIIEKYKVLGTGPNEKFKGIEKEYDFGLRIIIPIFHKNQLVSFQGRDITNKQKLRYKGCSIQDSVINYKHTLYNMDNCKGNKICVLEGITDVWRMGDGFVATYGTSLTQTQIRLLSDYKDIIFLFDSEDLEAQEKAKKYSYQLSSMGRNVEIIDLENDSDPGDLSEKEVNYIRKELRV